MRAVIGNDDGEVSVEPHALHGLEVQVRVAAEHVDVVRERLAAFSFHAEVIALE